MVGVCGNDDQLGLTNFGKKVEEWQAGLDKRYSVRHFKELGLRKAPISTPV